MLRDYARRAMGFPAPIKRFLVAEILAGIAQGPLWILRNLYLKDLGYSEAFIGQVKSVSALGTLVVALPLSWLMDRGALRTMLVAGAVSLAAGVAGTALYPGQVAILAWSLLAGAGFSVLSIGATPFYMNHAAPEDRPWLFGIGQALQTAAGLFAAAGVWALSFWWGEGIPAQKRVLLIGAVAAAASAALMLTIRDLRRVPPASGSKWLDLSLAWKLALPTAIIGLGAGLTIPFINLYFRTRFHEGPKAVSLIFSGAQIVVFFAYLFAPILARRWGAIRMVVTCQLLSIPFFLAMAFTLSPGVAIGAFLGRHALMNMVEPVRAQFMMEVVPADQRALSNGLREVSWGVTWMAGTALGGWLIERGRFVHDGFALCMIITVGLYIVGSLTFLAFWRGSTAMAAETLGERRARTGG